MIKKHGLIIALLGVILLVSVGFIIFWTTESILEENEYEKWKTEQQNEFEERNAGLYDKYNGYWSSKEDDSLYFSLYKNEEGCMCVSYTSKSQDGSIAKRDFQNISLCIADDPWKDDGNLYLQVYYDGVCGAGGWVEFLTYEDDDNKLGYGETVYYR